MILLIGWVLLALIPAYVASQKGRSVIGFFLLSLVVSPLIALIVVAVVPVKTAPPAPAREPAEADLSGLLPEAGMVCGQCRKPLDPTWRGMCLHCGVSYSQAAPFWQA